MYRRFFYFLTLALSCPMLYAKEAEEASDKKGPLLTEPVGVTEYLQTFAGLAAVVVLIVGMAWVIRRMGNFQVGAQGALKVLASISMGQRERVVLLQVGEKQLLIGVAPGQISTLHELEEPVKTPLPTRDSDKISFAERMAAALKSSRS